MEPGELSSGRCVGDGLDVRNTTSTAGTRPPGIDIAIYGLSVVRATPEFIPVVRYNISDVWRHRNAVGLKSPPDSTCAPLDVRCPRTSEGEAASTTARVGSPGDYHLGSEAPRRDRPSFDCLREPDRGAGISPEGCDEHPVHVLEIVRYPTVATVATRGSMDPVSSIGFQIAYTTCEGGPRRFTRSILLNPPPVPPTGQPIRSTPYEVRSPPSGHFRSIVEPLPSVIARGGDGDASRRIVPRRGDSVPVQAERYRVHSRGWRCYPVMPTRRAILIPNSGGSVLCSIDLADQARRCPRDSYTAF